VKRLAVGRVSVAFLLSFVLLVTAAAQTLSTDNATLIVAGAEGACPPVIGEAINDGDENLPVPSLSFLQPTSFRPAFFIPTAKRSVSQITDSTKRILKLYQLNGVLLI
jgi:hypothetical protein